MKRESTWHTRKKSIKHKWKLYWRNWGKRDVTCRKQIAQWQGKKSSSLSVITLNVNGLNSPIKRQKSAKWIFLFFFFFFGKMNLKKTWSNYILSRGFWQWVDEPTHWKWLMLGKIEGNRRTELQRTRWLESITHSMDMNLSKLWEIVEDRGAWHAAVHGVTKSQTWLSDWMTSTICWLQETQFRSKEI